jgi:hypothetical protein
MATGCWAVRRYGGTAVAVSARAFTLSSLFVTLSEAKGPKPWVTSATEEAIMSRTTRIHYAPALAVLAIIGAGLVRPGAGFAQTVTGDHALLNRTAAAAELTAGFTMIPGSPIQSGSNEVEGERALLGRTEIFRTWELHLGTAPMAQVVGEFPITGERALLGRWPVSHSRRPELWVQRLANEAADKS